MECFNTVNWYYSLAATWAVAGLLIVYNWVSAVKVRQERRQLQELVKKGEALLDEVKEGKIELSGMYEHT